MSDRVMQFRVGVMVLATAIIAGILIVLFGDLPSLVQRTYPLRMNFSAARGVTPGTPVRKNGILVGRVTNVALDEKGGVNVVADIDSAVPIYKDEEAQISGSILGDAEISLVVGGVDLRVTIAAGGAKADMSRAVALASSDRLRLQTPRPVHFPREPSP